MVTFPLRKPIQELQAAEIALPKKLSTYDSLMTPGKQAIRDEKEMKDAANKDRRIGHQRHEGFTPFRVTPDGAKQDC
jgi:hypothetical protein